jgi:DNA-binding transcriptional ArsR family regulator
MVQLHFDTDEPIKVRLAFSPLVETTVSFHALTCPFPRPFVNSWLEATRRATHDLEFPFMESVILDRWYMVDFLTPTPPAPLTDFEAELQKVRATPHDLVRANVAHAIALMGESDVRCYFMTYPGEALECLIDELRLYWQRALADDWSRVVATLENDLLYRGRTLAIEGVPAVIRDLNPSLTFKERTIAIDRPKAPQVACLFHDDHHLIDATIALVPTIFGGIHWQVEAPSQPMIIYPARGAGNVMLATTPPQNEALELVMGAARAQIMLVLVTPASTTELARRLSVTAGAISQHIGLLKQAGLVDSYRSRQHVYHRLTARGEHLMQVFS